MNESPYILPPANDPMPSSVKVLGGGLVVVFLTFLIAGAVGGGSGLGAAYALLFGWLAFPLRALSTAQVDAPALLVGLIALVLMLFVVDRAGRSMCRHATGRWSWRSTLSATAGVLFLFAAGIAMVAAVHQVLWVSLGRPPRSTSPLDQWGHETISPIVAAQRAAQRTQSRNQLKQIGLALHNYHDVYNQLPPGAIMRANGRGFRGWVASMGGYLSFMDSWAHEGLPWDDPKVAHYGQGALPELVHPALGWHGQFDERGFAVMHYAGNVHIFPNNRGMRLSEITDGTENTIAVGEVAENFQAWASPWNRRDPADGINEVPWGFGGPPWQHGAYFLMADGRVRMISKNIDRKVLKALGTPTGNEPEGIFRD